MTPAARLSAAIDVLDAYLAGGAPEQILTNWARGNRYAGSGDRAAIRDIVYDALRCRRSFAALGHGETGRALVLGGLVAAGADPDTLFGEARFAPEPLSDIERQTVDLSVLPDAVRFDLPDWVVADLQASLGDDFEPICEAMRHRASVFLRVNTARARVAEVQADLAADGIETRLHDLSATALEVTEGQRKIRQSLCYNDGLVELQDAASQAIVDVMGITQGMTVLDYCAGGGGKALALAAAGAKVTAHDIDPRRMVDLPVRADRAGVRIPMVKPGQIGGTFVLVFADAPCSGAGSWRRSPQGKWLLTREGLDRLCTLQAQILDDIVPYVATGGRLAYATCSMLTAENEEQIEKFVARHPEWQLDRKRQFTPLDGADGFFIAVLSRHA